MCWMDKKIVAYSFDWIPLRNQKEMLMKHKTWMDIKKNHTNWRKPDSQTHSCEGMIPFILLCGSDKTIRTRRQISSWQGLEWEEKTHYKGVWMKETKTHPRTVWQKHQSRQEGVALLHRRGDPLRGDEPRELSSSKLYLTTPRAEKTIPIHHLLHMDWNFSHIARTPG